MGVKLEGEYIAPRNPHTRREQKCCMNCSEVY